MNNPEEFVEYASCGTVYLNPRICDAINKLLQTSLKPAEERAILIKSAIDWLDLELASLGKPRPEKTAQPAK